MNDHAQKASHNLMCYISIFSENDWEELDSIVNDILINAPHILESPQTGDSRYEDVNLHVARFITRKNSHSKIVNEPYTSKILNVLTRSHLVGSVEQQSNFKGLKILRMQLNTMQKDSFVGVHTDKENDPIYEVAVLIRTTSSYSGGELHLYGDDPQIIKQENRTIFLMDTGVEHEVKPVLEGCRNSLVVFLGKG